MMVGAGEEDTAAAGRGDGKEEPEERQQLSISLETKMPPDVVAAVMATKSSSSSSDDVADEFQKMEEAGAPIENEIKTREEADEKMIAEADERSDAVDESLTISMLADEDRESEKSSRDEKDETKDVAAAKSKPTFSPKDDERTRIDDWIATVKRQSYQRASSVVYYDETMPSLDDLLAAREGWSQEFIEEALTTAKSSSGGSDGGIGGGVGGIIGSTTIDPDLDLTFEEYAGVICALLGVPIYRGKDGTTSNRSLIQSLHLAMSLFVEVQQTAEKEDIF